MTLTMATISAVQNPGEFQIIYLTNDTMIPINMKKAITVKKEKLLTQQTSLYNNFENKMYSDHDYIEILDSSILNEKITDIDHDHDYCFLEIEKKEETKQDLIKNTNLYKITSLNTKEVVNFKLDTIKEASPDKYEKFCTQCKEKVQGISSVVNCDKCNTVYVFICKSCNEMFEDCNKITHHLKYTCDPYNYYSCIYCNYSANSEIKVGNHVKSVHRDGSSTFMCQICNKIFNGKLEFLKHNRFCKRILTANVEIENVQKEQKKIIKERKKIMREKEKLRKEEEKLNKQRQRLARKKEKLDHGKWKNKTAQLRLKLSNRIAYLKYQNKYCCICQIHYENSLFDSNSIQTPGKCKECNKKLFWQCTACNKLYSIYSSMVSHLVRTFVKDPDYYKCLICGFTTQFNCIMKSHIKNIHKIGRKFFSVDQVEHKRVKDWVLNYDGSVYIKVTNMREQIQKDLKEIISIQCPECKELRRTGYKKCYKCKSDLIFECLKCNTKDNCLHLEMHKESIKFACHFCNRAFTAFGNYCAHELTCCKRVRLICDHCGFYSKYKSSMKSHMLNMHKDELF